jgi:hypothetical protein
MAKRHVVLNSQGKPVTLTPMETKIAHINQKVVNALGFEIDITTLTTIVKSITEQKFFDIAPADYVPVRVGEGAWSTNLVTYRSFQMGDDFETGILNTGASSSRLAMIDTGIDSVSVKVNNWAKGLTYTLMDLQIAAKSGNWDLVTSLEESRKKNWDLGIQRTAFLGAKGSTVGTKGLLNQSGITTNLTVITKAISTMSTTELKAFQAAILEAFRSNCQRTAWPTHFVIPESDYNGLASQASEDFPIKSTLQLLEEAFQITTRNKAFKILPLAYADGAVWSGGVLSTQRYCLYNYDMKSMRMDIPVDYTPTLANSVDNFSFQNAAYGQYTGLMSYRPLELMYFDY